MTPLWWAVVRHAGTAALVGLTALWAYYPGAIWMPVTIAVLGALGFQAVPTTPPVYKMIVSTPKIPQSAVPPKDGLP